jgi:hypothetical protein
VAYEALQLVVGLALTDTEFRGKLFVNPTLAVAGLPLSEEEVAVLADTRATNLEDLSRKLDGWISRKSRVETRRKALVGVEGWD